MLPRISKITELKENTSTATLFENFDQFSLSFLTQQESDFLKERFNGEDDYTIYRYPSIFFFKKIEMSKDKYLQTEEARKAGASLYGLLKKEKISSIQFVNFGIPELALAFLEGLLLTAYSFDKYKKKKESFRILEIYIFDKQVTDEQLMEMSNLVEAVFHARNLVNEPLSFLTAEQFSKEIEKLGKESGFAVEIFHKKKIESLKMGGLLAVNKGSVDPPTFSILEWKPENHRNKEPIVLVGKGVVFDTGGLSLKPTAKSMDYMKCDMAGGAVVIATIFAAAKNNLPVHLVGLVPATDNRPDGNAYVPGDIVTMFDGTTVEIKNTDAEGRLLLADALSYAKRYSPQLVIDVATLTGSASIIAGSHAGVAMGNSAKHIKKLNEAGDETYERLIEVPLWEEYAKPLKSEVADLNNLGTREAQSTIAGKFLEHFIDYDWIHLDVAGCAFLFEKDNYRPAGGTGYGTRLLYTFLKKFN